MMASIHNPQFAELNDSQLADAYLTAEIERRHLIAQNDTGADVDAQLDAIDAQLFLIDDELCARGLPLPR
jgi:hypothetical protein